MHAQRDDQRVSVCALTRMPTCSVQPFACVAERLITRDGSDQNSVFNPTLNCVILMAAVFGATVLVPRLLYSARSVTALLI